MIVSRKTYEAAIKSLEQDRLAQVSLLQGHIRALEERIADLRSLVFSPMRANEVPPVLQEADQILSPQDTAPEFNHETDAELRERDRIFSGEYDEALL